MVRKYIRLILLIHLCLFLIIRISEAQVKLTPDFIASIEQMDLTIAIPVEQSYKNKRIRKNDFFKPDHIIRSKKNKVEIQYALLPQKTYPNLIPHIYSTATIANLASNQLNKQMIVVHDINSEELLNTFKADWGSVAYFQPKYNFSKYRHAKLLSLFRAGKGMIYILFLFDDEELEEVNRQYFAASFIEEKGQ